MGNEHTLTRGQAQYMSAGTGVTHSEFNLGKEELRFMQMWIFPDRDGYEPNYGDYPFEWAAREGKWLPIATSFENGNSEAPIKIHAAANVYAAALAAGESIELTVGEDEQAYLVVLEGEAKVDSQVLSERDALEIIKQNVSISSEAGAHLYAISMPFDHECYAQRYGGSFIY
jgi:redox-sensitive bicupin YhaK (pirin superfamily)